MICQVLVTDYNNQTGWDYNNHRAVYGYKQGYYDFTKNGYTEYNANDVVEENGKYICISESVSIRNHIFDDWNDVVVEINNIQDKEYVQFSITSRHYFSPILIKKKDAKEIQALYSERNKERQIERTKISSYIDNDILDIAENLINIVEENIMTNQYIIALSQEQYSHIEFEKIFGVKMFKKDTYGLKGKEKKEVEKYNEELQEKYKNLSTIIDNFVEIIMEEKKIKGCLARAVAWEAIQRKTIEYYAQVWAEEYEIHLECDFDELCGRMVGQDIDIVKREYIGNVILSGEIDISHVRFILMYYLISKEDYFEISLHDSFLSQSKIIQEVTENINSSDIKSKLKTKQKRRISKYTIDDVDLMNGAEFEEFVGLLFKKMGYSSQVTKQSGDQGLDVIASKNGTKVGIQAKCYSNTVGNSAVQEAVAGKSFYNCDKVIVITNNYFTSAAMELARSNGVILWNRDMLKEKIKELM